MDQVISMPEEKYEMQDTEFEEVGTTTGILNPDFEEDSGSEWTKEESKVAIESDENKDGPVGRKSLEQEKRALVAVKVRNAVKTYGKGKPILNSLTMSVTQHTIYSLLGTSECGKTTLLSCIVGIKKLQKGQITVFGCKPGTRQSGVPGKRVGYMPQNFALYNYFTISESLNYFGALYGMTELEICSNRDFFIEFLDLPDPSRQIGNLSGGQKRRVSLAIALIHSPELLILDEPTVGVDPLLRDSIWNHLVKLVTSKTTTVIIATEFIEEARMSDTIGLMRRGRLLAEESPQRLLEEYNTTLLEEIVLQLCKKDDVNKTEGEMNDMRRSATFFHHESQRRASILPFAPDLSDQGRVGESLNRLKVLVAKNILGTLRNLLLVTFLILLPSITMIIYCVAIGNEPKGLDVGVVNHDANYSDVCVQFVTPENPRCDVQNLSCKFLAKIPNDTVKLHEYETIEKARSAVDQGKLEGFLYFPHRFSQFFYSRLSNSSVGNTIENETLFGSRIQFELDFSNNQVSGVIKKYFTDGMKNFTNELLKDCGLSPELGDSPLKFVSTGFAQDDTNFRQYIAPSIMLGIVFLFPIVSSSVTFVRDKKEGTLERSMVAGVKSWEIMVAFATTEIIILTLQTIIAMCILTLAFGSTIHGSFLLVFLLSIGVGICALSLGFMIASICNEEIEAVVLILASYIPNFVLSGMIWPLEGMPKAIQTLATLFLPCSLAGESIRSIVTRGWTFSHSHVWPGFLAIFFWTCFYSIITISIHKFKASRI